MKKSILAGALALTVLSTGALAYNKAGCNMQGQGHHGMKMMKKMHHGKGFGMMSLFKQLNLTDKQQTEIRKIMQETMKKKESKFSAFGKDSFDKEKFIKQAMNKKENMIKLRAEALDKAYGVLTKKQKSQLRVLMDLKEEKGMRFDRYCNGRG